MLPEVRERNFTDPESRIMPYQPSFVQAYNAQIAVDSAHQIIVATDLSDYPKDDTPLKPMVRRLPRKPGALTADAGYGTTENILYLKERRIDAYTAIGREKHGPQEEVALLKYSGTRPGVRILLAEQKNPKCRLPCLGFSLGGGLLR